MKHGEYIKNSKEKEKFILRFIFRTEDVVVTFSLIHESRLFLVSFYPYPTLSLIDYLHFEICQTNVFFFFFASFLFYRISITNHVNHVLF